MELQRFDAEAQKLRTLEPAAQVEGFKKLIAELQGLEFAGGAASEEYGFDMGKAERLEEYEADVARAAKNAAPAEQEPAA